MPTTKRDPLAVQFGARMRAARERVGIATAAQMGRLTGIRPAQLSKIENGHQAPSLKNLVKIVAALGISADYLLSAVPVGSTPTSNLVVGNRIRRERESRGIGVQELADRCGVARGWIERMEAGMCTTGGLVLNKIANVLGVSSEKLLTGTDTTDPTEATEQAQKDALVELPNDGRQRSPRTVALQVVIDSPDETMAIETPTRCGDCMAFGWPDENGRASCNAPDGPSTIWVHSMDNNARHEKCPLARGPVLLILD